MAAESYRVLFEGRVGAGKDPGEVKARLGRLFGKSAVEIDALFSGRPSVLKTVGRLEEGQKLVQAIARAGAVARLEPHQGSGAAREPEPGSAVRPGGVLYRGRITVAALLVGLVWLGHLLVVGAFSSALLYHLLFNLSWYGEYGPAALLTHTVPGFIGLLLLAALVKPLIPLRPRPSSELMLDPERQRQLYGFVEKVCRWLDVPAPRRIVVSGGTELELDFGVVPEIPAGAPTLRLGLTLVNGLTCAQLAALLGRELGFMGPGQAAQRTQFVRATHRRFEQAVFGQDALDTLLERLEEGSAREALAGRSAARLLGLSRRLHLGLLMLVHRVAAGPLRHLERRSDRWQAALAGSDAFRSTLAKRRLLELACETAAGEEERRWLDEGKLSERLPTAALNLARTQSAHFQREVQQIMQQPDGEYALLPADIQRIERVEKEPQPAAYVNGRPARELLSGFERLSRRVSYLYYRNTLRLPATPDRLVPAAAEPGKSELLLRHYLLDLHRVPVRLHPPPVEAGHNGLPQQIRALAQRMKEAQAVVGAAMQKYTETDHRLVEANVREVLAGARLPLADEEEMELEAVQEQCRQLEAEQETLLQKLQEVAGLATQRLAIGLARAGAPGPDGKAPEIDRLRSALRRTDEVIPKLRAMRDHTIMLELLLSHLPSRNQALADRIEEQAGDLRQLLLATRLSLREAPWPFTPAGTKDNLARHAIGGRFEQAAPDELLDVAAATLSRTQAIRQQILIRLVQLAMAGERRLLAG